MIIKKFGDKFRDLELNHSHNPYYEIRLADLLEEVIEEYEKLVGWCISIYPEGVHFDNQPEDHWIDPFTDKPYPHVTHEFIEKAEKRKKEREQNERTR